MADIMDFTPSPLNTKDDFEDDNEDDESTA